VVRLRRELAWFEAGVERAPATALTL